MRKGKTLFSLYFTQQYRHRVVRRLSSPLTRAAAIFIQGKPMTALQERVARSGFGNNKDNIVISEVLQYLYFHGRSDFHLISWIVNLQRCVDL